MINHSFNSITVLHVVLPLTVSPWVMLGSGRRLVAGPDPVARRGELYDSRTRGCFVHRGLPLYRPTRLSSGHHRLFRCSQEVKMQTQSTGTESFRNMRSITYACCEVVEIPLVTLFYSPM